VSENAPTPWRQDQRSGPRRHHPEALPAARV